MTVRAKFQCLEVKHLHVQHPAGAEPQSVHVEVRLTPVYGDGKDNATWSKYTPAGELKMTITNPPAAEAFEIGKAYYLDFTPAE
ncbi:MAG: hypothetical protein IKE42_14975 [Aquamicrobium sp.]|nr:hypothetical protein [Aquamicrobium sp.]